jgi:G:T-mismatch repair DNA endonuclease (very short patch repair protein)
MADPNSVFQSEAYRQRISAGVAKARAEGKIDTLEASARRLKTNKETWADPELRRRHAVKLEARWKELGYFPWEFKERQAVSSLELKLKSSLEAQGYKHSLDREYPRVGRYTPDFLDEQNMRIIEIYGDYWHCNPTHPRYGDPSFVHPELGMTSAQKWVKDERRVKELEEAGYTVRVIWESEIL